MIQSFFNRIVEVLDIIKDRKKKNLLKSSCLRKEKSDVVIQSRMKYIELLILWEQSISIKISEVEDSLNFYVVMSQKSYGMFDSLAISR